MLRWTLLFLPCLFTVGLLQYPNNGFAAENGKRPNVVLFLIDDLGSRDIGADGSTFHDTPRLDALARSGVRFTDFHSGHPVCSPTRASLMSGKVPQRVGITDWIHPRSGVALPAEEITLGEAFQSQGYQTAYLGKWHLGEADEEMPGQQGFEWTRGVNRAGQPASYYFPFKRPKSKGSLWDVPDLDDADADAYLTDVLTDAAIEFLNQRDPDRPFLMCFAHYAVHTPIQPPRDSLPQKYEQKRQQKYGDSQTPTIPAPFESTSRGRQDNPQYAAMVENLDANIGRVLDTLDQLNLTENTIVVFTSDNGGLCTTRSNRGGPTCNLPERAGKGWNYEGGIRVPLYISWKGHLTPGVSDVPGYSPDLYPTLLQLCGLPLRPDQHLDGVSLVSALEGHPDAELQNRTMGWYYPHDHGSGHRPSAAWRKGDFKLIYFLDSKKSELYNLKDDPGELHDLSSSKPEQTQALTQELLNWIAETTASNQ